jgi:vacuolar-type H+-ATPase subunit E/Vma4
MITVDDKLNLFTKRIIDRQQQEYDSKVESLEVKMLEDLEDRKKMLMNDRSRYETTLLKGIKNERSQRLSNARSERKRRLLLKRKEMIDVLLEGVKSYTSEFVHTDEYESYLKNMVEKNQSVIKRIGSFKVYLNEKDFKFKSMLTSLFDSLEIECSGIEVSKKKILGGMIILKSDQTTRLDLSLDSVIEDNKKYMGQLIYDMLEEAGEFSG